MLQFDDVSRNITPVKNAHLSVGMNKTDKFPPVDLQITSRDRNVHFSL